MPKKDSEELKRDSENFTKQQIASHLHDGNHSQRVNFFDIFGSVETLSAAPTETPGSGSPYDQLKIYNGQLYWFDFNTNAWQHAGGGAYSVAKDTNGTTNVDVFTSAGAPFPLTITAVYVIAKDTTASNITVLQAGNTVCTIAKGVTAGVMTGATSLSNTVYAKGDVFQVDSSGTGNATVIINFTA